MKTKVLLAENQEQLEEAIIALQEGKLVAFPTDTVYGLGAHAFNSQSILKLFKAKRRREEMAIPVLIANSQDLDLVADSASEMVRILADRSLL